MRRLEEFTMARVGLPRAGNSLATRDVLRFQVAHARARDAVHEALDTVGFQLECRSREWDVISLHSAAPDRQAFLRHPHLGRCLDSRSKRQLSAFPGICDLAVIVADGLSALAIHRHVPPLLALLFPLFGSAGWTCAPLFLVEQGRVAIGDEIGAGVGARMSLVLIGERPGLSSPDSLGAYLTWNPAPGRTDAERNCISNIRLEGLAYDLAAARLFALMAESRKLKLTGVALKEVPPAGLLHPAR